MLSRVATRVVSRNLSGGVSTFFSLQFVSEKKFSKFFSEILMLTVMKKFRPTVVCLPSVAVSRLPRLWLLSVTSPR